MENLSLVFESPRKIGLHQQTLPRPQRQQLLVETACSAISPGTEMLIYRGEFPAEMKVDENIPALTRPFAYPLGYGYSNAGHVLAIGPDVDQNWVGKRIFSFQPHTSHYLVDAREAQEIPYELSLDDALFLPAMETALNLVMDGAPLIGQKVIVFGQGVVGLLVTALLASFPLEDLVGVDLYPARRQASLEKGARHSFSPADQAFQTHVQNWQPPGADLTFELSGSPDSLDQAIQATGFSGKLVAGSWYGRKPVPINLGGWFHRSRIHLVSSQVSTIDPALSGRWDKHRRFQLAWKWLAAIRPGALITHRFPLQQAAEAYRLIDERPGETIQVIFSYV